MNKKVVVVYDPKTEKLIAVCGVRDLTPEQFESFTKEARKNIREILKKEEEERKSQKAEIEESFEELTKKVVYLAECIRYILGAETLTPEELNYYLDTAGSLQKEESEEENDEEVK